MKLVRKSLFSKVIFTRRLGILLLAGTSYSRHFYLCPQQLNVSNSSIMITFPSLRLVRNVDTALELAS